MEDVVENLGIMVALWGILALFIVGVFIKMHFTLKRVDREYQEHMDEIDKEHAEHMDKIDKEHGRPD